MDLDITPFRLLSFGRFFQSDCFQLIVITNHHTLYIFDGLWKTFIILVWRTASWISRSAGFIYSHTESQIIEFKANNSPFELCSPCDFLAMNQLIVNRLAVIYISHFRRMLSVWSTYLFCPFVSIRRWERVNNKKTPTEW